MKGEIGQREDAGIIDVRELMEVVNDDAFCVDEEGDIEPGWRIKESNPPNVILERKLSSEARQRGESPEKRIISREEYRRINFPGSKALIEYFFSRIRELEDRAVIADFRDPNRPNIGALPDRSDHFNEILKEFIRGDLEPMYQYLQDRRKQEEEHYQRLREEFNRVNEKLLFLERLPGRSSAEMSQIREKRSGMMHSAEAMTKRSEILFGLEKMIESLEREMQRRAQTVEK